MGANESLFGHNITDPSSGVGGGGGAEFQYLLFRILKVEEAMSLIVS